MLTAEPGAGCRVIVMAKAPRAGFAKTRLIPALGATGAAALAARFLSEALSQAQAAGLGEVELCGDPHGGHPDFAAALAAAHSAHGISAPLKLSAQGEGDLGQRMERALLRALDQGKRALLMGTDAPALDAAYLRRAAQALEEADAVFGPAADGGYALVGLRRPVPHLFDRMVWSTSQVMAQTRERLLHSGARWAEMPLLYDVDEPRDLQHVPRGWL